MKELTKQKRDYMERLSTESGIIGALAIDQRGALKKMLEEEMYTGDIKEGITTFKGLVSEELTPYATAILLDPEYGLPASHVKSKDAGLLLAYEKTGYDLSESGRFPDLIDDYSVHRIKKDGADAVKFLLYYDVDEGLEVNQRKHAFVERIGSECVAEDIPFYLELISYDKNIEDSKSKEYANLKPHKVNNMMIEFSKDRYHVDVLKVEIPVNMDYVEGLSKSKEDEVYSKEETIYYFKEQSDATDLPFIFLSAGVSPKRFKETLILASLAGSTFNGVLCGRATWKDGVAIFVHEGEDGARKWLRTEGKKNIEELNELLCHTATSWHGKVC